MFLRHFWPTFGPKAAIFKAFWDFPRPKMCQPRKQIEPKKTWLSIRGGPGSPLEKCVFDRLFALFWSQNGQFSRHSRTFHGPNRVTVGSKWPKNTCLSIPNVPGSLLETNISDPLFTPFGPKTTHFPGNLGRAIGQTMAERGPTG